MDGSFAIEEHPWQPFLPQGCRLLMLGSFPPARKRWCMDFFYPNYINDMWRIFGIVFFGDKQHFVDEGRKQFRMDDIIRFMKQYFALDHYVRVSLYPETMKPAIQTKTRR